MEHDIGAAAAIAEGTMRRVELDGEAVLLARVGGTMHAIGATCPHAGGPLDEGVLCGGEVICPWHKAAFRLADGRCSEPPAVDDVPHHHVREQDGRLLVTLAAPSTAKPVRVDPAAGCMVVIGAGGAGAQAAQTLREEGYRGRVVMLDRIGALPGDRTLLSKATLAGKETAEKTPLQEAGWYAQQAIERVTAMVTEIDPATHTIDLEGGGDIVYDAAFFAPGGVPKRLDVPGGDLHGVHVLRSADDVAAILRDAAGARHVVVVGAGYIGLEVAASLRARELAVCVVAPEDAPLAGKLGPKVGAVFRRVHERKGVTFRLGEEVVACEGDGKVERVRLRGGEIMPADLVVAGLGIAPATAPLRLASVREDGGIEVDARLRAADALYVGGDVAAFPLRGNGARVRVEHWRVAQQHGRLAALNMLGRSLDYTAVPYFWTIQYGERLDYVGHADNWDEVVIDGDLNKPDFVAFYVKAGVVEAVAAWGRDRPMAAALAVFGQQPALSVEALRAAMARS